MSEIAIQDVQYCSIDISKLEIVVCCFCHTFSSNNWVGIAWRLDWSLLCKANSLFSVYTSWTIHYKIFESSKLNLPCVNLFDQICTSPCCKLINLMKWQFLPVGSEVHFAKSSQFNILSTTGYSTKYGVTVTKWTNQFCVFRSSTA